MSSNNQVLSTADLKLLLACASEKVFDAALIYIKLKRRVLHPAKNKGGGKRITLLNRYECCAGIRPPSNAFPFSEVLHGRTATHVAHQEGIPEDEGCVRRYAWLMEKHPFLQSSFETAKPILANIACQQALASFSVVPMKSKKMRSLPVAAVVSTRMAVAADAVRESNKPALDLEV